MADTLDRLRQFYGPRGKAVVWAHNTHVGDARATDMADAGMVNIGQLARERHGRDQVVLVGFGCHRGRSWPPPRGPRRRQMMTVPPARPGSLEELLHATVPDTGPARLRRDDGPDWLTDELDHRAIGVVYDPASERAGNYVPTRLGGPLRRLHLVRPDRSRASTTRAARTGRNGDLPQRGLEDIRTHRGDRASPSVQTRRTPGHHSDNPSR